MKKSILAAGCFWAVQHKLDNLKGVLSTKAVYAGGEITEPSYQQVCDGNSGHAEAVFIEFDEEILPFRDLLLFFFSIHNATQLNRQGPDIGSQYRSAVFCFFDDEITLANNIINELQQTPKFSRKKIQTIIEKADLFYDAEEFHQKYYKKKGF